MNAPSRFELFVLADGESKLTVDEDTKIPNAATVTINKEDHTLANMLRSQLLLLPYVIFSGYRVPHPLEPRVVLKIQTDGSFTPIQAVQQACDDLIRTLASMKNQFQNEVLKARARDDGNDGGMEGMEGGMAF
ncbi:DNA-directed RNA polymerase II subunit RPB11, partial [Phenoliferia sp. Uapishka_3]